MNWDQQVFRSYLHSTSFSKCATRPHQLSPAVKPWDTNTRVADVWAQRGFCVVLPVWDVWRRPICHSSTNPVNKILSCHSQRAHVLFLFFFFCVLAGCCPAARVTAGSSSRVNTRWRRGCRSRSLRETSLSPSRLVCSTDWSQAVVFYYKNCQPRDQILIGTWWITGVWIWAQQRLKVNDFWPCFWPRFVSQSWFSLSTSWPLISTESTQSLH